MRNFDDDELERRVDEVLFYVWDPIGISDEPCARWEYKSYVAGVLSTLSEKDDACPIADHLSAIVTNIMGLPPNREHSTKVAELLLRHKNAIAQGLA